MVYDVINYSDVTSAMNSYVFTENLHSIDYTGWSKKTSQNLCNYNGAYTSWGEISFSTLVDQYVLLLTYKYQ